MKPSEFARFVSGRRVFVLLVASLVFALVSLYRFNTLGGALAGFDNDHFLHFAYAKQVQAGEQPLRDFLDAGLQGARPSLTYELSAAAQHYGGNNLRSEAWLTVAGVAMGAAVAFLAGSSIAPWPWALVTAMLSALVSPKLYGYPKVLLLALASMLIVRYTAAPTWRRVGLMAVCTAVAFLFRHDYAVYCAVGFVAAISLANLGAWRRSGLRVAAYVIGTVILLGPSLWWIQRYTGLVEYMRNALEMSQHESYLTRLNWPLADLTGADSVPALLAREENTQAWLYYLFLALPIAAIAIGVVHRGRRVPDTAGRNAALIALGLMTLVLSRFFLRASLEARFGDMAPPVAVTAAVLLATATARRGSRLLPWLARATAAVTVLIVTLSCVWVLQSVRSELFVSKLLSGPTAIAQRASQVSQELAGMPTTLRVSGPTDRMEAARYLHDCTRPTDRVLVVAYTPEVLAFAERLFAGDRATFVHGFYADERYTRRAIESLARESVPIVLAESSPQYEENPLLANYLRSRYVEAGTVLANGLPMRVLAQRAKTTRQFGSAGLPCFT